MIRKQVKFKENAQRKVTAIFGPPPPPPLPKPPLLPRNDSNDSKSGRVVNQSDTQLLFNIEALKIAKKARDLREGELGKNKETTKVRGKSGFFQQLRKFRSLPNLSAIRNLKMIRNLSRSRLDTVEEDRLLCPQLFVG